MTGGSQRGLSRRWTQVIATVSPGRRPAENGRRACEGDACRECYGRRDRMICKCDPPRYRPSPAWNVELRQQDKLACLLLCCPVEEFGAQVREGLVPHAWDAPGNPAVDGVSHDRRPGC